MEQLEVSTNPHTGISEAPLQLKANGGTLVIDDFGRQRMRIDDLLNRWIVPLEAGYDFYSLSSGRRIQMPFQQVIVFSTNLEPRDLVDEAFLRRIPYKIPVGDPTEAQFRAAVRHGERRARGAAPARRRDRPPDPHHYHRDAAGRCGSAIPGTCCCRCSTRRASAGSPRS